MMDRDDWPDDVQEAVRHAVIAVDARWQHEYSERFATLLLEELDRAGYRVVAK